VPDAPTGRAANDNGVPRPESLDALVAWFESLAPQSVSEVNRFYAADAYFKDPFNEVQGADRIRRIYAHMFEQVRSPRFRVTERWLDAHGAMLLWDFLFERGGREEIVRGASHLRFAPDGRIAHHRDYWDAAEELYAKLPLIGALMRFLQGRLRAPQP
jgi:hypothetical protein